jgi:hypothetical protein
MQINDLVQIENPEGKYVNIRKMFPKENQWEFLKSNFRK